MRCIHRLLLAALIALAGSATWSEASTDQAAAKTKYIPPVKGQAQIGYLRPQTKVVGNDVITTFRIKNMSTGRIAGLKVEEFWWDKNGNPVTGGRYIHKTPLNPGEVITVTIRSTKDSRMDRNNYTFTHANGTIKPTLLKMLDEKT